MGSCMWFIQSEDAGELASWNGQGLSYVVHHTLVQEVRDDRVYSARAKNRAKSNQDEYLEGNGVEAD